MVCDICGINYTFEWRAPNYLWKAIVGNTPVKKICKECFDLMAEELSVTIYWEPNIRFKGRDK